MTNATRSALSPRLVLGVVIILVGVLLTLDNLGLVDIGNPFRLWPLILVIVGVNRVMQARAGNDRGWGIVLVVVGLWLLLESLDLTPVGPFDLWPLLLVAAGGALVWQAIGGRRDGASPGNSDATMSAFALLSGVKRRSVSQAFRGGDLTAVLGGCDIDLTRAATGPDGAVIDVFALWGGVELTVPPTWTVVLEGTPLLGGMADKTAPPAQGAEGRLVVRGFVIMGGCEIKNP